MARLQGGIHLTEHKLASNHSILSINIIDGDEFIIPFSQHIGSPAVANVVKGESVIAGTLLAKAGNGLSVPIHSPVAGMVKDITKVIHPMLGLVDGCIIVADSQTNDYQQLQNDDDFSSLIKNAGIVGLGGAGFPTYIKQSLNEKIDTILINASECEPYLTCDDALMISKADEIMQGIKIIKDELKISTSIIAIEDNKKESIKKLSSLSARYGVDIVSVKSIYPQGGEKQLIKTVLDRTVMQGSLPSDVGVVVQNVATIYAIYEAVVLSKPLYERVVTVSGDISNHVNVWGKVGTIASRLISNTNNISDDKSLVFGGPMTGTAVYDMDTPIVKTTGGVLLFSSKSVKKPSPCIRCGKCIEVCTMGLVPTDLERFYHASDIELMRYNDAMSCIECGCCSYICPSNRLLSESIKTGKRLITQMTVKKGA